MYIVVCGKADMLDLVHLFNRPVECGAQTVGHVAATLGKTNACCAMLDVGSVDCHTFLVAVIGFGQAGPFVLCEGNAVLEGQVVAIAQSPEHLLNVLLPGYLALPAVFLWIRGYDGFCHRPFVVVGHSCCSWRGRRVGKVWQMHYAIRV